MPIVEVSDIAQEGLWVYTHLSDAKLRASDAAEHGLFVAESSKVIERALDAGIVPYSMFVEDRWLEQSLPLIERMQRAKPDIPVFRVDHAQMSAITGFQVTRGALAAFERPPQPSLGELLAGAHRIAVLEDITNFTNIGSIFRSAAALGIDGIVLTKRCHDPLYKRAARVSMGAVFQVPWVHLQDQEFAEDVVPYLHARGFTVAAMDLSEGAVDIREPKLQHIERLALVLGTEGDGIAPRTRQAADLCIEIPMAHGVDSLNVAAASTLAFWELRWRGAEDTAGVPTPQDG